MTSSYGRPNLEAHRRAAILFIGIFGLFWASFLVHIGVVGDFDVFAALYERGAHIGEALFWVAIAGIGVWACNGRASRRLLTDARAISESHRQTEKRLIVGTIPFLFALLPFILIYQLTRGASYAEQHKFINESLLGKSFYLTYWYFSILIAEGIRGEFRQALRIFEFIVFAVLVSVTVPLRSFILIDFLILLIFVRAKPIWIISGVLGLAILFIGVAVARMGESLGDVDTLKLNVAMFGGAPSAQIDLYFVAMENDISNGLSLTDALESAFSDYFAEGGGFGSFLPLEVAFLLPGIHIPVLAACLLAIALCTRSRALGVRTALICMGAMSVSILRNPLASWIKGYAVFVAFTVFHVTRNRHRSTHL